MIMLVGPPLSGKDTYLRTGIYEHYEIISRDDILMSLHNNDNYSQAFEMVDQKRVDKLLNDKIQKSVDEHKDVIINMTNLVKRKRRGNLSKFPSDIYEKIAIVFPRLDVSEYEKRNNKRKSEENKSIPFKVIMSMINSWDDVTLDEGFDKIIKL